MTFYDVASFINARKSRTRLSKWDESKLVRYVYESAKAGTIRVATDGPAISGVVIFNPDLRGQFWIEQIWADGKDALKTLFQQLHSEYPSVKEAFGIRHGNRSAKFNVTTTLKFYGR